MGGMVSQIYSDRGTALLVSGAANNASGGTLDARGCGNYGVLVVQCSGNSAIWDLMAAADNSTFVTALTVTATVGTTGMYQISAYYPYVKFATRLVYSAAGGSARVNAYYRPGYM